MSLLTWTKKYYPMTAFDLVESGLGNDVNDEALLKHALRKWRGLRPFILKMHGLKHDGYQIFDKKKCFNIDGDSCTLCHVYGEDCTDCPIVRCTEHRCDGRDEETQYQVIAPFQIWLHGKNPEPMIKTLKKALKYVKSKNSRYDLPLVVY